MKPSRLKSLLAVYFVGVLALYAASFWYVRHLIVAGLPDFAIYYCAGTVVRQGLGPQLYDPGAYFEVQRQFATAIPLFRGPLPWTHPPFEALFFVPFSFFSYVHAYILWNLLSVFLMAMALFLLRPCFPLLRARASGLWIIGSASFFPLFFNLLEGQDAIVLLFLYALVFLSLRNGRDIAAGAFLALGLFKFHLVLPFLLLILLQKRWKTLYGFLPVAALLTLLSVIITGVRALHDYPHYVFYWEHIMEGKDRVPAGMPNLRGLIYVLFPEGSYVLPLLALLSFALFLFVAWRCRAEQTRALPATTFSLMLLATVLVSYHVVSYDLSMLLIPALLTVNQVIEVGPWRLSRWFMVIGIGLLFFAPLEFFFSLQHKEFALMGFALLLWTFGAAREISLGNNG